jgi:hypothetical protein
MSATSTNKEPLLIDRPLLKIARLDQTSSPAGSTPDPGTGSNGVLLVDAISNDGALIEDIWLIQRVAGNTASVNLYLSSSNLALGASAGSGQADAWFLGRVGFSVGPDPGETISWTLPKLLAPVPFAGANDGDGNIPVHRGLRISAGLALWASVNNASPVANAPSIAVQGGWY